MLNLHYKGTGLPFLCLHGWGFDHTIWQCLSSIWPNNWQMISVDLPGHGETPSMPMDTFTNALLCQLPQTFVVIGWSLGGLYAFDIAKQAKMRLKHLFAVATSPCFMKKENWPGIESVVLTRFYRRYVAEPVKTVKDFIELQFLNQANRSSLDYSPALPTDARLGLALLEDYDLRENVQMNSGKLSFILGQQDAIVPANLASALVNNMGIEDTYIIDHCGHMPFLTHGNFFINHIQERIECRQFL